MAVGVVDGLGDGDGGPQCPVEVELVPAPSGLGLAAADTVEAILELAGVEDAWTKSHGNTRTTMNLAKATYNALRNSSQARGNRRVREATEEEFEEVSG